MPEPGAKVRRNHLFLSAAFLVGIVASGGAAAEPTAAALESARAAVSELTPRDAGGRYGQALGAIEVCIGTTITDKAAALPSIYEGADLDAFKAQSSKIYDAWIKVKPCANEAEPSQCKVIAEESCAGAIAEIGPSGTILPGLLDPPQR
jgi:hypothetical protein